MEFFERWVILLHNKLFKPSLNIAIEVQCHKHKSESSMREQYHKAKFTKLNPVVP